MYIFSPNLYTELAEKFLNKLSSLTFYNGTIEFEYETINIRFVATIIPYFSREYDSKS